LTRRLYAAIEAAAREHPTDHWVQAFRARDVPAGPCLTIEQHLHDGQVVHNHIYEIVEHEPLGRVRRVRYPAVFSEYGELWPRGGHPELRRVTTTDGDARA
ncbi:MAG TPA: CoA transferase, partial [Acidimicrobiales bacterium]|nr:CoA transferase [Acidimicrobiales bacterium]